MHAAQPARTLTPGIIFLVMSTETTQAELIFSIADDKLILGHRNSDWTGLGPILEEDIAFSSLAQDEMAHAQALYEIAGGLLDERADDLAFGRSAGEFRCARIVELPDDFNWAFALARRLFCNHFERLRVDRLANSSLKPLADLAKRIAAEQQVQVEHIDNWIVRLGRGTDDAQQKIQTAVSDLAEAAVYLFEPIEDQTSLVESGMYPGDDAAMYAEWKRTVEQVLGRAGLSINLPDTPTLTTAGGRRGEHSPHLAELLEEMTEVYRVEPGAQW